MLQFIKPIIVLTYIDNNSIYHWLCRNYKNSKFIAVQNGIRQVLGNERYKKYRHDIFYCYGEYDIEKHKQLGCSCNEAHPIGSLRAGLIRNESDINIKKYDICLISSDGRRDPDLIKDQNIRKIALENRKIDSRRSEVSVTAINSLSLWSCLTLSSNVMTSFHPYSFPVSGSTEILDD